MEVTTAAGGVSMTSPMGFAEALSDDGSLTAASPGTLVDLRPHDRHRRSRPQPTFVIGEFQLAVIAAVLVVVIELGVISWVRHRDMDPATLGRAADRIG
jgi:hypothetical protein